MSQPELSVVLPILDEAELIDRTLDVLAGQLSETGRSFEIVCVDDGSTDGTGDRLAERSAADERVVPVTFSRNFGKEAAVLAGLEVARGRAVVILDADLQHPPELVPEMVRRWEAGFDVVDAVKVDRGRESWLYRRLVGVFHAMLGEATGIDWAGASDFKLLDRQVVDALLACPERSRFFRGLVAWAGFRVTRLPFEVAERPVGRSKWLPFQLITYSLRNLVAFSPAPLRVISWIGLITVVAGAFVAGQTLYNYWTGEALGGFTTVILLIYWLSGLILLSLGVIGYYLSQMYEEQKARPLFIVRRDRGAPAETRTVGSKEERGSGP
jgi:glycosyltransferase involved in cell wall biosynthesis